MKLQGNAGCLCGAVRLELSGEPAANLMCHCKECQKSTGGNAVFVVLMPKSGVALLSGTLTGYAVKGGSGEDVRRTFCPTCGTPVFSELDKYPNLLGVKAGLWDTDPGFAPSSEIWTASAPAWHHIDAGLPNFPGARG